MNEAYRALLPLIPEPGETRIPWDGFLASGLGPCLAQMADTPQNPQWHGEGDVLAHTRMACESLIRLEAWQGLARPERELVFLAALLHDIGKTARTRLEDGQPVSPHHAGVGEGLARTLLWKEFGLSGTAEAQQCREAVCALIRCHGVPFRFLEEQAPVYRAIRTAAYGDCVPLFSNALLAVLAEADIRGRMAPDTGERLMHLDYFREVSGEAACLTGPRAFPSAYSRYAYLSGRNIAPGQELYDDTWGRVVLLAGLPGTGKDTYARRAYPELPVVSLDDLRRGMGISPREPQGRVVAAAQEQARAYLRKEQSFVWNATNFSPRVRAKQAGLCMRYRAAVQIDYLETGWEEMLRRNRDRAHAVPEPVIAGMLEKLAPPNVMEAHEVRWIVR